MNTTVTPVLENVTLYYREGSSDKVYQCAIEPAGPRFVVNFAYGRRGTTLNTGTKTNCPVDYDAAKRTYDKLVREKTAKGYTPGEDGTPYHTADNQTVRCDILPQLLNPIDETAANMLLRDAEWCMQEKIDGRRLLLQKSGGNITGFNRKGLVVGLPSPIVLQAQKIPADFLLDGELVGDVLHAFDLLRMGSWSLLEESCEDRLEQLAILLELEVLTHIERVGTAFNTAEKARLFQKLQNREGVVFKRLDAPYTPGRPNSGGSQLKHKFYARLSAMVGKLNPQRSMEIRLINKLGWVTAGNVTIPPNVPVPSVGDVVEIRYLYAFRESGVLYQPVYLGRRTAVDPSECVTLQLKFKSAEDDES